jgi:hypothetical protein
MHLSPNLERAKTNGNKVAEVYILARVYSVHDDPQITLYADPWQLYREGQIVLESASYYRGNVSPETPAFLTDKCVGLSSDHQTDEIYKDLRIQDHQIRLLKLTLDDRGSRSTDRPIKATIDVYNTTSSLKFLAISYVWGDNPTKDGPFLEVNGVLVPITLSLWTCLSRLQDDHEEALIWADAICINQMDDVEKAIQVRRMGALYSKADKVIIWTGNATEKDKDVLKLLSDPLLSKTLKTRRATLHLWTYSFGGPGLRGPGQSRN